MQDKHVVIFHGRENRDLFINKVEYSKTIYHIDGIGGKAESNDIVVGNQQGTDWIFAKYIVDHYDNLHEYTIFTQADPSDHVEYMDLAIQSKFTDKFGSFNYARSLYEQYTFGSQWGRLHSTYLSSKILNVDFDNCMNRKKSIYICYPGTAFYIHRDRIRERPKSFYENIIKCDNDQTFFEYVINYDHPKWLYDELDKYNPELRHLSKKDKIVALTINYPKSITKNNSKPRDDYFGVSTEPLWGLFFFDKKLIDLMNKAQQSIGNLFSVGQDCLYPYSNDTQKTILNFKLLENSWFDYECPYYLKWREKLIEHTMNCGNKLGFDGQALLNFYERIGYKHISL